MIEVSRVFRPYSFVESFNGKSSRDSVVSEEIIVLDVNRSFFVPQAIIPDCNDESDKCNSSSNSSSDNGTQVVGRGGTSGSSWGWSACGSGSASTSGDARR